MKYHIITYGCQMNRSDSERIAGFLDGINFKTTSKPDEADLIVVNMCSVRQSAVDRVYGLLVRFEELKKKNRELKTALTGCIVKKDRKRFIKGFDLVLDIKDLPRLPSLLFGKKPASLGRNIAINSAANDYLAINPKRQEKFSSFVPISTGCNNACAYCVVPSTKGALACRSHNEIIAEIKTVAGNGCKEVWLLGQNVNNYRSPADHSVDFSKLLKMINDIKGAFWIRFTSPHPKDFSEELIETMAASEKVTPYLNLPVQSGSDILLKKMNRPYSASSYKILIKKIRAAFKKRRKGIEKNIALSTDTIVGFPGETKKQFNDTAKLYRDVEFDMAYIAQYSKRNGTAAALMEDSVSREEKAKRRKILTKILMKTTLKKNKKYAGKTVEVLVDSENKGLLYAKTRTYKTVRFPGKKELVGKIVNVKINKALVWGLEGKLAI